MRRARSAHPLLRTAAAVALAVGLVAGVAGPGAAATPEEDTSFVRAVHADLLGREPTGEELEANLARLAGGFPRAALIREVAFGLENLGQEVDELYQQALHRAPDQEGYDHWVNTMGYTDYPLWRTVVGVYVSREFVIAGQAAPLPTVELLFERMLGRECAEADCNYWAHVASKRDGLPFAVRRLYESAEHRRTRVTQVFQEMLGRAPDAPGLAYWMDRVTALGDIRLAARLAATPEYAARAVQRFPAGCSRAAGDASQGC